MSVDKEHLVARIRDLECHVSEILKKTHCMALVSDQKQCDDIVGDIQKICIDALGVSPLELEIVEKECGNE